MNNGRFPIYYLSFPSPFLYSSTMLRFAEHCDSPRFRGKVFDLEEFMDWYATTRGGEFTYHEDWGGCNIPSRHLQPFLDGRFDPLTKKEAAVVAFLRQIPEERYYLIASSPDSGLLLHEMVHALYDLYPRYRRDVRRCLCEQKTYRLSRQILAAGYAKQTLLDEMNAYLTTGLFDMQDVRLRPVTRALRRIFKEHFGYSLSRQDDRRRLIRRIHHYRFVLRPAPHIRMRSSRR